MMVNRGGSEEPDANHHKYVDLGLPSGLKWATCNIGATKPEECGLYFAWGETEGYTAEQVGVDKQFSPSDYQFSINGSDSNLSKYNSTDGLTTLELADDAARVNMGGNWRIPTTDEWQELISNTSSGWRYVNSVKGIVFISKSDISNYIFVPCAGNGYKGSVYNTGTGGNYWSSSLYRDADVIAHSVNFSSSDYINMNTNHRYYGYSVRGVLA